VLARVPGLAAAVEMGSEELVVTTPEALGATS
jgi:hypothetical protein